MRILAAVLALAAGVPQADPSKDAAELLAGVSSVASPGSPGTLAVFGDAAFAVVAGRAREPLLAPVIAAARMGSGRIVAFGHTGYFDPGALGTADTGRFVTNAVRWAAGRGSPKAGVLRHDGLVKHLQGAGIEVAALSGREWWTQLGGIQVVCLAGNAVGADAAREALAKFVSGGGGVLWTECGWGWLQLNPGKTLQEDHPGNRLMAAAGLVWADGNAGPTEGNTIKAVATPLAHAGRALDWLLKAPEKPDPKESAQAELTLVQAAQAIPPGDRLFLPRLQELRKANAEVPSPQKPLKRALPRLGLALEMRDVEKQPAESVRPHPAAEAFPGAVPAAAPRVKRTVTVDTRVPGWHGTGLYAAPGERVIVRIPETAAGRGLHARIGCHTDHLWHHASWSRVPSISRRWTLEKAATTVANAFGGLLYVEVPSKGDAGTLEVVVEGAVESPRYVLGRTTAAEWKERRAKPGPWAELETAKVVLSVPSERVRAFEDPEELMKFWDRVLDACADLSARPRERERPERIAADVQISAGYMHSGYPVMTHLDAAEDMADLDRMRKGPWGLFHELGHNHQSGDWTFDGAGEVTVNLFTRYVQDTVCGIAREKWRHTGDSAMKSLRAYLGAGAPFDRWKSDPFLALTMYDQVQGEFGWEAFKKVFAEYRALPGQDRPRGDAEKRDQWLVRVSRTVGRNLGPFFQAWGVPTSESARASVASLPAWMPKDFPGGK
jgi:hypothetical protein